MKSAMFTVVQELTMIMLIKIAAIAGKSGRKYLQSADDAQHGSNERVIIIEVCHYVLNL
jgi:hypothetical protein